MTVIEVQFVNPGVPHAHGAYGEFSRAMEDPKNLLEIHAQVNTGPGRRVRELVLNRAAVILSVAAWQAYVQDLTVALLEGLKPPNNDPAMYSWRLRRATVTDAIAKFSSPTADEARKLLASVAFDPRSRWNWTHGPKHLAAHNVEGLLNEWVKVRHALAHGDSELPAVSVLTTLNGRHLLWKTNAESCVRFFRALGRRTLLAVEDWA